jgi:hypothetical protein
MLPFGVTTPVTVPQRSEIPDGLKNNPVFCGYMICKTGKYLQQRSILKIEAQNQLEKKLLLPATISEIFQ